jgi:hypothetical protein
VEDFQDEIIEYIAKYGLSRLLIKASQINEDIVKPGTASSGILAVIHTFLAGLSISTDMVIVDPYFFPTRPDPTYHQLAFDAIKPVLSALTSLKVVTQQNSDASVIAAFRALLAQAVPSTVFTHFVSSSFHDRFWINPLNSTGFITGTSLNGLGRKYALIDRMQDRDVIDIVDALKNENVL